RAPWRQSWGKVMKRFSDLYRQLDDSNRTRDKVDAMAAYFREAPPEDAIWAVSFLMGRRLGRIVPTPMLRVWAAEMAGIPQWLFDDSYHVVGDLAETISLVLPPPAFRLDLPLHVWVEKRLMPLKSLPAADGADAMKDYWNGLDRWHRFVLTKLVTGALRVGVSRKLLTRALSAVGEVDAAVISHRLMGQWSPTAETLTRLLSPDVADADASRPYPFFLAYPLGENTDEREDLRRYQVEWKWDGIRSQVIRREGSVAIWTRGEEMVTDRYPEIDAAAGRLPDGTVLDGEILPWASGRVMDFGALQRRIGRKTVTRRLLETVPVILMAYDLLEHNGRDIRSAPLQERRSRLERLIGDLDTDTIRISPTVTADSWEALDRMRQRARQIGVEGVMVKRLDSVYGDGRRRGIWWKWKVDPLTVDAVLIYAQSGHGRRAGLFTDYTFGVWDGGELVPFAKAYSGLDDEDIRAVDRFVRRHTRERFGPVRSVAPVQVFEIAFEAIRSSTRHKSGVAVRFPRIHRWRTDKGPEDADSLDTLKSLLTKPPSGSGADMPAEGQGH
ncbi:MAG: ATP-dependent DNA ligase, partial [Desulfobacterales bacterium]